MTDSRYAIGIMSGTSVDGIDAVILETSIEQHSRIVADTTVSFSEQLRRDILRLTQPGEGEIDLAGRIHIELGELYAKVANSMITAAKDYPVSVIGCHGQTVRHRPNDDFPFTLQLGSGPVIAARTGIAAVTDFRSADMAAGGQGAPFAPFFHNATFRSREVNRCIVNLGGIANITLLPSDQSAAVSGFDSGPANGLMDAWIQRHRQCPYDRDGKWAAGGNVNQALLTALLMHPYFARSSPKSTGREEFNIGWLDQLLEALPDRVDAQDVQRTLVELTARTVVEQIGNNYSAIYLCGGGVNNRFLVERISALANATVHSTAELGIAPMWMEAAAFAWMALQTIDGIACTLPSVTGASSPTVTGAIYHPVV